VLASAVRAKLGTEKFAALAGDGWRTSPLFSDREKAAIRFCEETTVDKAVSEATFEEERKHFKERGNAEHAVEDAKSNFYNMINVALDIHDDGLLAIAEAKMRRKA